MIKKNFLCYYLRNKEKKRGFFKITNNINFIYSFKKKNFLFKIITLKIVFLLILVFFQKNSFKLIKNIKIALCTVGKKENLYVKEFIEYYINLGIDHIFIYDDNDPNTEKISAVIDHKYKKYITIYDNLKGEAKYQSNVYNDCYKNHNKKFDWLLMIDMDEFLFLTRYKLKNYLTKSIFNKCDFIKFNWVIPTDNNLIHYDNRSLFKRFKGPYKKSKFVKSIIRGNIPKLKYMVHSPYESPIRNITCNSSEKKINNKEMNLEYMELNIKESFIIHFKYKSTEEYINKYKRGYRFWKGEKLLQFLNSNIKDYLNDNEITLKKLEYFEKELKINLSDYKQYLKKF